MSTTTPARLDETDLELLVTHLGDEPDVVCTALPDGSCPHEPRWIFVCPSCRWTNLYCDEHRAVVDRLALHNPIICTAPPGNCLVPHPLPIPWRSL